MDDSRASKSVAVVGYACRFAGADDIESFWTNLVEGKTSFREVPLDRWDHSQFHSEHSREHDKTYVQRGAFMDDVSSFAAMHFGVAPRRVEVMDPQHRLVLDAVRVALQDAGMERGGYDAQMVGTFLGVSTSEYRNLVTSRTMAMLMSQGSLGAESDHVSNYALGKSVENVSPISAFSMPGTLLNMAAANVAHQWKFGGPAYTVDAACASSLVAVHDAIVNIRAGICDMAVAGGVYLNLTPESLVGFSRIGAISRSGECRPFDAAADGFLQGDGCGVLVLKRLDLAVSDGDRIHAVIRGTGINNDGDTTGPMAPALEGQTEVIRRAWADAGLDPTDSMGYVECHGTATPVGDPVEVGALRKVLGDDGPAVNVGSVKANIGHTMSAAGVAGLLKAILAVEHGWIPAQPGFETPNEVLELDRSRLAIDSTGHAWSDESPRRAGVSAFGFGGTNCHMVVEAAPEVARRAEISEDSQLVVLSAGNHALLAKHAGRVAAAVETSSAGLADIAYSLTQARSHEASRLAIVASSKGDLVEKLRDAAGRIEAGVRSTVLGPDVFVTSEDLSESGIALMFPGQGAQRVGLLRDAYDRFDGFRERLDTLLASVDGCFERPLIQYLYPDLSGEESDLETAEKELQETHICQTIMGALGLAFWGFLREDLGVKADVTLGHSLGEFVAVAAAGLTDDASLLKLVCKRGLAMANLDVEDRGAMAAIMGDVDAVEPLLKGTGLQIANRNHPQQTVVSGPTTAIEELVARLEETGTKATKLRVSHAFHSSVIEGVGPELEDAIAELDFREGEAVAVSAIDVGPYSFETAADIFSRHATSPVDFIGALEQAQQAGAAVFLEVGAGTTLTRFASKTLSDVEARSFASADADANREFFRTLAWLSASGIELELRGLLNSTERRQVVSLPATPLETQAYWVTRDRKTPLAIAREAEDHIQAHEKPMSTDPSQNSSKTALNGSSLNGSSPSAASFNGSQSQDGLVELFRQQNEILREHARIMAAQAQALGHSSADVRAVGNSSAPTQPDSHARTNGATHGAGPVVVSHGANVASKSSDNVSAGTEDGDVSREGSDEPAHDFRAVVYDAVAEVSAFPVDALKDSQELAADLGFDSLMFVDLASALQGAIKGLGQIPQDAFDQKTTLGDVVAFLTSHVGSPEKADAPQASGQASSEVSEEQTLRRFATTLVQRRRPKLPPRTDLAEARLVVVADEAVPGDLLEALEAQHDQVAVATPDSAVDAIAQTQATGVFWWLGDSCDDELEVYVRAHHLAAALYKVDSTPELFVLASNVGHEASLSGQTSWLEGLRSFARSVSREWTSTRVKCVDTSEQSRLLDEVVSASNEVVVRYDSSGNRWVDALSEQPFAPASDAALSSEDVVLMTGATGGVGAIITREIARRSAASLVLVGRTHRDELSDEVKAQFKALEAAGSSVDYVSWDVTNQDAPARLTEVFETVGQPTVFVHAAGLTRDSDIASKSTEDIELVTGVKTLGFDHVLAALSKEALRHVVAFTSWSGVFGNRSQSDYAAANAALDARIAKLRSQGLNARSMAWPAWESTEMVQEIPHQVRELMRSEGVTFIDDASGADAFFDELATESDEATILYAHRVPEETRSVDTRFKVSLESHPYLRDHVLKEKPVMPFASALDYVATAGIETTNLDGPFAIEDFTLSRGIEVAQPVTLHLRSRATTSAGRPEARIEVKAQAEGQRDAFVAYGGRFVGTGSDEVVDFIAESPNTTQGCDPRMDLQSFYDDFSFHGPTIQAITSIEELGDGHAVGRLRTSRPADLLDSPSRDAWTVDPRVLDGALQLTLYYLQSRHGVAAYPTGFSRYVQLRPIVDSEVRVTLVRHEMSDERVLGSLKIQTLDGELLAVMSNLSARVFEAKKTLGVDSEDQPADDGPEVDEIHWKVSRFPEVEALEQRLQMADLIGISNPYFAVHDGVAKNKAIINGSEMINFSSYNYLGFSGHPEVSKAAKDAVDRYGTSVSASRLASGQIPLHAELEEAISSFMGVEAALVFSAGHHTNESVIGHLFNEGDLIIHDSLAHNSILTGAELSGAKRMKFPHNDHKALEKLLKQLRGSYNKVGIMIEGVYSMDGDIPDLPAFIALKEKYKCLLYVDEAHSAGCIGPRGAGVADYFGIDPMEVDVWMGTLSKSFSSCGGYCAGSEQLIQYLKYTVPGFIFSAGISPANAAAALAAVRLADAHPEVVQQLQERSKFFLERCKANGLDTGPSQDSAVVPVVVGNSMECLQLSEALGKRGINVQPIVYPAVDDDAARLRFFMSATHEEDELAFTADTVAEELNRIQSGAAAE